MSTRLTQRGATLPLTIIVIAIMGVAVAISFASSKFTSEQVYGCERNSLDAMRKVIRRGANNLLQRGAIALGDLLDLCGRELCGFQ